MVYSSSAAISVTAVIPFFEYSVKSYEELGKTIKSLQGQVNHVLIVVDNPLKPFNKKKIEKGMISFEVVTNETNKGCLGSRIEGWKHVTTEFIMNIDSGDTIDKNANIALMEMYSGVGKPIQSLRIVEYNGYGVRLGEDLSRPKNYYGGSSICGKVYPREVLLEVVNKYPQIEKHRINNKEDMLFSLLLCCSNPKLEYEPSAIGGEYIYQRSADSISNFKSFEKIEKENRTILELVRELLTETDIKSLFGANCNWRHLCKCFVDYEYAIEKQNLEPTFPIIRGLRMREFYDTPKTKIERDTELLVTDVDVFLSTMIKFWRHGYELRA